VIQIFRIEIWEIALLKFPASPELAACDLVNHVVQCVVGEDLVRRHVDELTDPTAVSAAIAECRELGRDRFRRKYGYGRSTIYPLIHENCEYDSKAIAGVAFGIQHTTEPLKAKHDGNHGGMRNGGAGAVLKKLGFTIGAL
jgi:hypothetical protein